MSCRYFRLVGSTPRCPARWCPCAVYAHKTAAARRSRNPACMTVGTGSHRSARIFLLTCRNPRRNGRGWGMNRSLRALTGAMVALSLLLPAAATAQQQEYPTRPVTLRSAEASRVEPCRNAPWRTGCQAEKPSFSTAKQGFRSYAHGVPNISNLHMVKTRFLDLSPCHPEVRRRISVRRSASC